MLAWSLVFISAGVGALYNSSGPAEGTAHWRAAAPPPSASPVTPALLGRRSTP
ncbi:MAG: hypothetical protein ACRBN8_03485 [Nannocystales bacterium]